MGLDVSAKGGMRIYLAGPLFTTAERDFNAALAGGLRTLGHEVWLPQESEQQQTTAKAIFDSDVRGIDWCEVVVACMDGTDPDSGTCWEVGSVWQRKPTVLYRTDIRCESLPLGPYKDDALLKALKAEPVLHADETSWWVARSGFSLWVLTNGAGTCYRVVASRSRAQAEALLGDYQGVLVSDCLNIYDDLTPHQHKCYAHHLKAISKALEDPKARASQYLPDLRALLQGAMALGSATERYSHHLSTALKRRGLCAILHKPIEPIGLLPLTRNQQVGSFER
jgi:nucleoside 2-deoxyribosyltransferase